MKTIGALLGFAYGILPEVYILSLCFGLLDQPKVMLAAALIFYSISTFWLMFFFYIHGAGKFSHYPSQVLNMLVALAALLLFGGVSFLAAWLRVRTGFVFDTVSVLLLVVCTMTPVISSAYRVMQHNQTVTRYTFEQEALETRKFAFLQFVFLIMFGLLAIIESVNAVGIVWSIVGVMSLFVCLKLVRFILYLQFENTVARSRFIEVLAYVPVVFVAAPFIGILCIICYLAFTNHL